MSRKNALVVAASAAALIGALSAAPSSAYARGAAIPDGPTYQMPSVGECHDLVAANYLLMTTPTTPVDCATEHTALVSAVAVLPADTDWDRDGTDIKDAVDQYCLPAFYETLGGNFRVIAKTAYTWQYWIPNAEQRSHGASWIRCDINLLGLAAYLPLPVPLLVGNQVPNRIKTCLMVLGDNSYASSCEDDFNYTLDKVFLMPGGATLPKRATILKFAKSHCPAIKHKHPYWVRWGSQAMWAYGDRTIICYREA